VVQKIGGQADGGIRNSVQRLRAQTHLVAVGDAFAINELQPLDASFSSAERPDGVGAPDWAALSMSGGMTPGMLK